MGKLNTPGVTVEGLASDSHATVEARWNVPATLEEGFDRYKVELYNVNADGTDGTQVANPYTGSLTPDAEGKISIGLNIKQDQAGGDYRLKVQAISNKAIVSDSDVAIVNIRRLAQPAAPEYEAVSGSSGRKISLKYTGEAGQKYQAIVTYTGAANAVVDELSLIHI